MSEKSIRMSWCRAVTMLFPVVLFAGCEPSFKDRVGEQDDLGSQVIRKDLGTS